MEEHKQTGILDVIASKISYAAMWMSAAIVVIIFYEVIARYLFSSPTLWAYELSWWLAGALYLISGLYVMQQRAHIRLTLFYDLMPLAARRVCDIVGLLIFLLFCFVVIWGGFHESVTKFMNWEGLGSAWNPPIPATLKPLILITLFMMALQAISNLYYDWRQVETPNDLSENLGNESPQSNDASPKSSDTYSQQ